jgi:hypothetical protein
MSAILTAAGWFLALWIMAALFCVLCIVAVVEWFTGRDGL